MGEAHDEELRILRARAYGPAADIHADTRALERLRDLEAERRPQRAPREQREPEPIVEPRPPDAPDVVDDDLERRPRLRQMLAVGVRVARSVIVYLGSVRRSTWLIVVGVAVIACILGTVLVVVQRVQTDPLQVGATQIARLSVDPGYEIPEAFGGGLDNRPMQAFQEFHGLRTVMNMVSFFNVGGGADCFSVYAPNEVSLLGNGYSGQFMGGCSAGDFPAMTQFSTDLEGFPAELREAFPDTALQFVYDRENNEIVVFASAVD